MTKSLVDEGAIGGTGKQADSVIILSRGLHKTYHTGEVEVQALRGVDLEVGRGEMVAVMGPSGCGKTTLLNCLSGLDEPTAGDVEIAGRPLYQMPDRIRTDFRAQNMGFVFQFFNLLPVLSAVENIELTLLLSGTSVGEARRRALAMLDLVGLSGEGKKRPAEMSGGQQQRVAVARALINEPAIVWADEPTGNLDSETSAEIMDLLCRLNAEKGQTFVIVTHAPEVGARAARTIRMRDGLIEKDESNRSSGQGGA